MKIEGKGFNEDHLLRYHWAIEYGGLAFNYRVFKEKINKSNNVTSSVINYTNSLKETSYVLKEILDPSDEESFKDWKNTDYISTVEKILEGLQRLRAIATFIPLLLASRVALKKFPAVFADITTLCEVYAFRVYKLSNRRADTGKTVLYDVANEFFKSRSKFLNMTEKQIRKTIQEHLERILSYIYYYCSNDAFRTYLSREDIYSSWGRSWLEGYEVKWKRACKKHKEPPPSWKDIEEKVTIEHILPETPENYEKWSEDKKRIHREIVHKLGNLTLATWE